MQRALHLALTFAASGIGVICAVYRCNAAVFVGVIAGAFYYIGALEPYLAVRLEPEVLLWRVVGEIVPFYIQLASERHAALSGGVAGGQVFKLYNLLPVLRPVFYNELYRVKHGAHAVGLSVKVLPEAMLQHGAVHYGIRLGYAYAHKEVLYCLRRVAAPSQCAKGRHARVVPAGDVMLLNKPP